MIRVRTPVRERCRDIEVRKRFDKERRVSAVEERHIILDFDRTVAPLRELRIAGKLVHADGVARRVEVRDDDVDEGLAAVDREFEVARRGHTRREHDLRVRPLEALLHR